MIHVLSRALPLSPGAISPPATRADTLLYQFTVEDRKTWTRPWTAAIPMKKMSEPVFEYACHEGNYAMRNILSGARADEKAAAARGK